MIQSQASGARIPQRIRSAFPATPCPTPSCSSGISHLERVAYGGERIILARRGKDLAALVPVGDLEALEALEDRLDVEAARKAMADPGPNIPYEKVREELGLGKTARKKGKKA